MRRPLDDAASAYCIRKLDIVIDPSHQHLAGFPLAPSPMPKDSPQGHYTDSFGPGPDGTNQYIYHLQQSPSNEQGYPSPEAQAPVTPYSTSHYSITLADHENLMYNNVYLPQSYVNLSADHQPSLCHALETQQRQQHSQQPGYEQNMSTHSSYMIPHTFTDDYSELLTQKPVTTGHSYGAGHAQASLQSPLSQPSQSPKSFSTLGPLTPQCPPSPRLSPLSSPQLSTPSEVNIFTDNETLSTPPAHVIARLSCRECGMVKKDIKSLQRHSMEKHCKPRPGETKKGWFRCACGALACHYRKTNHTRHLSNCKPHKWQLREFVCQCLAKHSDKDDHIAHYMKCTDGKKPPGRPRGA